ncbi:unnamed protein product [Cylindrotheca closterium]|uniref:Kinesin light chain n=1 Tax=Cylindrotheca closterium TaxID=2856 RepID=A0AAD2PV95_9STRA|nr:unnamed protein product [Cylindrotheca closterium]
MIRSRAESFSNNEEDHGALLQYWSDSIAKNMSNDENLLLTRKLLLARKLCDDDWCTWWDKQQAAQRIMEREDKMHSAQGYFHRGWYWLHMGKYSRSLFELKKALNLYDKIPPMAEVSVERQQDFLERKAKCHYALGQAMMGTFQMGEAEKELYRAWRISANYEEMESMTKHVEHLMEVALSHNWGQLEAHCRTVRIKNAIEHEVSADCMYASGNLHVALEEYRKCLIIQDEKESYLRTAQAHVRCKLAATFQSLERLEEASYEWATALRIYRHDLGPDHSRTLATMKRFRANHAQLAEIAIIEAQGHVR